jgi:hypothetical protein
VISLGDAGEPLGTGMPCSVDNVATQFPGGELLGDQLRYYDYGLWTRGRKSMATESVRG